MSAVTQQQQQGPGARRVTLEQIAAVQTMIERCMQLYMAKDEVMACLKDQANIELSFSQLVWQKLEEQNADFFRAYNLRVQLKNQVVLFNQMLQQQLQMLESLQHNNNSWTAPQPMQGGAGQSPAALPGTSMPQPAAPVPASSAAAAAAPGPAASQAPSPVTTALEQEQFQQEFNRHLQQHVQRHLQQQLANGWPLPFGPAAAAAGMPLQALSGLPYQTFMPNPAALAAAAAAAAAASSGAAGPAMAQTHSQRTASTGTGGTTPMAAAASNSRGFARSTTDMLAAWGLGSSPSLAAAAVAAAAATASAGDAAAPAASPAGSTQQQQQQQQQQQLASANAAAAAVAAASQQPAAAYMQQAAPAVTLPGSSSMHLVSSCAMLDVLPAAEQMPLASLPKPFSMSDLNALDIPGQIANDLGDFSGLPYPGDAGSSAAAAAAVAATAAPAAAAGGPPERQLLGMSAADCGVGPGMQNAAAGAGGGSGGDGGGTGQQQVDGMPAGFTLADLGQLDMVMDMLR